MPRTNCIELCIIMHAWHPPGTIVRASRTQTGQPEHGQAQKLATLAQFWAIPFIISGLHCQLILGVVFRVELTENITRLCSRFSIIRLANGVRIERRVESKHLKLWRCKLSSRWAKIEPGVILLINREYGANQKRKSSEVSWSAILAKFQPKKILAFINICSIIYIYI